MRSKQFDITTSQEDYIRIYYGVSVGYVMRGIHNHLGIIDT